MIRNKEAKQHLDRKDFYLVASLRPQATELARQIEVSSKLWFRTDSYVENIFEVDGSIHANVFKPTQFNLSPGGQLMKKLSLVVLVICCLAVSDFAQKSPASGNTNPSPGGGGGSLAGVVFLSPDLPQVYIPGSAGPPATPEVRNLLPRSKQVVLCFLLKQTNPLNANQAFVLEPRPPGYVTVPVTATDAAIDAVFNSMCNIADSSHPLLSGSTLVIAVDSRKVLPATRSSLLAIALNVTSVAGTAVTTAPVRNSMAPGAAAAAGAAPPPAVPDTFFLRWPVSLGGDTIPTATVTALYRSPDSVQTTTTNTTNTPPIGNPAVANSNTVQTVTTKTTPYNDAIETLLTLNLPQVHPLYYYNVATGVVVSFLHNPTFTRALIGPSAPGQYTTLTDNGDYQVAPVLMFTGYIVPLDAERDWRRKDLIPGLGFGFSLSSPATSFYFGGSSEFRRNVQLVGGLNLAKVTALQNVGYVDPTSSAAPATKQVFKEGGFIGLTLNISFIQGLFTGGGGSKSSGN